MLGNDLMLMHRYPNNTFYSVIEQPEHLRKVIEFNEQKLEAKREQTEESVRQRGVDITAQLGGLADDIKGRVLRT